MKVPKTPLSREAHEHLTSKIKRGEKFHSRDEKKKAVKRCQMYDRGYKDKKGIEIEYGR